MEQMPTIAPGPRRSIGAAAAAIVRKLPVRFTSITWLHASAPMVSAGAERARPAHGTTSVIGPNSCSLRATKPCWAASSRTSSAWVSTSAPAARNPAANRSNSGPFRSAAAIRTPCDAK
jgi:hypothetical protein